MLHTPNFFAGWTLILAGFVSGAALGLGFTNDEFLGGYSSLCRRLTRLGHIALVALGILNVLFAISAPEAGVISRLAGHCFIAGGISMPAACFLTAWRPRLKPLFALPIAILIAGVAFTLCGGPP